MAIAFAYVSGDVRTVLSTLRGVLSFSGVENIKRGDAAGWWRTGSSIVKLDGVADDIDAAVEAACNVGVGGVTIFQRHDTFVPGGPMERKQKEEDMEKLLRNLEEAKGGSDGIEDLMKQLSGVQGRVVDILDKAYRDLDSLWPVIGKVGDALEKSVKAKIISGSDVARLFKKYRIDASALDNQKPAGIYLPQLNKGLLNMIEVVSGVQLFPEPYKVKESIWTLIEK